MCNLLHAIIISCSYGINKKITCAQTCTDIKWCSQQKIRTAFTIDIIVICNTTDFLNVATMETADASFEVCCMEEAPCS